MNWRIHIPTGSDDGLKLVDYTFILYFTVQVWNVLFFRVFALFGLGSYASAVLLAFLIVLIVLAILSTNIRKWEGCIALYTLILLVFLTSYILTPELGTWYANEDWGLAYRVFRIDRGIYAYLVIKLVEDPKRIMRNLNIVAILMGAYLLAQTYQRIRRGYFIVTENDGVSQTTSSANMAYGYNCVFVALIFFAQYRKDKKKTSLIAGILFSLLSVLYGSRGCLIVLGAYFIITQYFKLREEKSAKKMIRALSFVVLIVILYIFYDVFIPLVSNITSRFGIHSDTISSLLNNSISDANGRDRIWLAVSEQIKNTFPLGKGAFGDRLAAGKIFSWGYSHNIFFEMTASFGVIGVIALLVLLVQSGRILITNEYEEWSSIFTIFFCCCMKLLVSDSFWYSSFFWGALAIGSCALKYNKKRKQLKK